MPLRRSTPLVLVAALAVGIPSSAAARSPARIGTPVVPARTTGTAGDGRLTVRVTPPGQREPFGLATFERPGPSFDPPGTIRGCHAYGRGDLRDTNLDFWGMTCAPRDVAELAADVTGYQGEHPLSPARYAALRRAHRRLPGVTLVAGRLGAGALRVRVRGGGIDRVIATDRTDGGFLVAWGRWLEATTLRITAPSGEVQVHRSGRARVAQYPGGRSEVVAPQFRRVPTP